MPEWHQFRNFIGVAVLAAIFIWSYCELVKILGTKWDSTKEDDRG